ncbi:MAG: DUF4143 domain-containing protein [Rhodospirillales bacterium]|nr:DUF4143 domain-containing protein [Rhodospirillales bacterium]
MLFAMIARDLTPRLTEAARTWPSITLTGPRQSGKTTLCRALFPQHRYETLEAPDVRAFATEDPRAFLAQFPQGAILDEVQRAPELLSYLQGIIDADPAPGRWILTGSQNLALQESVSQSLAGRTAVHNLLPLTRGETIRFSRHPEALDQSLFAGSYPRIFDAELDPADWLASYVATYIERDVRTISNVGDLTTFQRFVALCAGRTAQLLNYSSLAGDCGISQPTARAWLGILETSFLVFRLPPLHSNLRKRLVKMPKLHFYDTGLVCWLLGIRTPEQLHAHPLRGAIFETWVVSEIAKHQANHGETTDLSFYRDRNGAEVDLIVDRPNATTLVEAKSAETASSSLFDGSKRVRRHLTQSTSPCSVVVVYGGDQPQRRGTDRLVPWREMHELDWDASDCVVIVRTAGQPISGVSVLALFPNKTWKSAVTDENGTAVLDLHTADLPMTVFVAVQGFAAHVEHNWTPAEGALDLELTRLTDGGAVIFRNGTGHVPVLQGRLNPILDTHDRTNLYADNIAINGGLQQPVAFAFGEELHLCDAEGQNASVRIVSIVGRAALVQYHRT